MTVPGVAETARSVATGETTARAAVDAALARVEAANGDLNAFSVVLAERARAEADARDAAQAAGEPLGPLHGVPVAIKEELDVEGCVTTFGGVANTTPVAADSEVVRRLRAAGAVIVGKTLMPEFGAWPFTESVAHGITRNPWALDRSTGGSSGGTAAAVAAGLVPVGLGGDGGGSIRIPSAACGLFGLKPQRGRVTFSPLKDGWFKLSTIGPLARSVRDSALVYDVIRGSLPSDSYHAGETGSFAEAAEREPGRLRIGWTTTPVTKGVKVDPAHVEAVAETVRLLTELGHDVREIDPHWPDPTAAFIPQFVAGLRGQAAAMDHPHRVERRTRETIRLGLWATPKVVDAALRQTDKLSARVNRIFDDVDVLLTPTQPHRPPTVPVLHRGTVQAAVHSIPAISFVALWNLAGNPAAHVPCGIADDGLPVGVQLVGRTDGEPTLLSLSAQLESARPWPLVAPAYDTV